MKKISSHTLKSPHFWVAIAAAVIVLWALKYLFPQLASLTGAAAFIVDTAIIAGISGLALQYLQWKK